MIYFDNAATSMVKPDCVVEAVCEGLRKMGNSGRGTHGASLDASRMIFDARDTAARFFGLSDPTQVVFTANATESLNVVINGLFQAGDHVITTQMEHNSVLRPLYRKEVEGVEVTILPCDKEGNLDYSLFEKAVRANTKAIICTHASNLTGNLVDLEKVGEVCEKRGLYFIVDAAQTAGVFPIHVEDMKIDILSFTGHKGLLGPQGTGGLCIRKGIEISPLKVGGSGIHTFERQHPKSMPAALEAGTLNGHGIAGLAAGIRWLEDTGLDVIYHKEEALAGQFYRGIQSISGVTIYGNFEQEKRAAIVSFNLGDWDSGEISDELANTFQIYSRGGGHCAPLLHQAMGTREQGAVRFSFSYFNTEEQVEQAIQAIRVIANEY